MIFSYIVYLFQTIDVLLCVTNTENMMHVLTSHLFTSNNLLF